MPPEEYSKTYRMYVDETGDHANSHSEGGNKRYLGLTGVIFENKNYKEIFHPAFEALKQKHFPARHPDDPTILHRRDIIDKKGCFGVLKDKAKEEAFNNDLLALLEESKFKLITVVIDKKSHFERYQQSALHPYHYCLVALLERYCGRLNYFNVKGDVLAESRGGKEDMQLKGAYKNVFENGTSFRDPDFFKKSLTSKEIKIKQKLQNIAGLQLADLLAHPCKVEILYEHKHLKKWDGEYEKKICSCAKKKYNKHIFDGHIEGYGKIFLG